MNYNTILIFIVLVAIIYNIVYIHFLVYGEKCKFKKYF